MIVRPAAFSRNASSTAAMIAGFFSAMTSALPGSGAAGCKW
jgi:hypothetical protein